MSIHGAKSRRVLSSSRALNRRDEGDGGADGRVVDLDMDGDGLFNAVYTVPVEVGTNGDVFHLQVDTGSSDLWIASTSCSSSPCTSNRVNLYNPGISSRPTTSQFDIDYLSGHVEGPIVWDDLSLGGYPIAHQAMAAATVVVNQTLSPDFSGVLGLALPLNSLILQQIPAGTTSDPDGAPVSQNLFGISPISNRPPQFFYSIALGRPGSSRTPSVLGIGRHPSSIVDDPSRITYLPLLPEQIGTLFWKVQMRAMTVIVDGREVDIDLGTSVKGSAFNEAILDTGVPYIIARPGIANAIWGALGIGPAGDGNYYVPCTTPLTVTVTLGNSPPVSLHPLDLTAYPSGDPTSGMCVGLIQSSDALNSPLGFGDIILGVPFLRSVYTVMSYLEPDSDGTIGAPGSDQINPRLGLLGLTDPERASKEFSDVRVFNRPIDGDSSSGHHSDNESKSLPVGVIVLLGLLGFCALCALIFLARWWWMRRRYKYTNVDESPSDRDDDHPRAKQVVETKDIFVPKGLGNLGGYQLAPWGEDGSRNRDSAALSNDTQSTLAGVRGSVDTPRSLLSFRDETDRTRVNVRDADDDIWEGKEMGLKRPRISDPGAVAAGDDWDPRTSWLECYSPGSAPMYGEWRPDATHEPGGRRSGSVDLGMTTLASESTLVAGNIASTTNMKPLPKQPAASTPLLAPSRSSNSDSEADGGLSPTRDTFDEEFGVIGGGMAGVGTARRGSVIDQSLTAEMRRRSMALGGIGFGSGTKSGTVTSPNKDLGTSVEVKPSAHAESVSIPLPTSRQPSFPPPSFPGMNQTPALPTNATASSTTEAGLAIGFGIRPKGLRVATEPTKRSTLSQVFSSRDFEVEQEPVSEKGLAKGKSSSKTSLRDIRPATLGTSSKSGSALSLLELDPNLAKSLMPDKDPARMSR